MDLRQDMNNSELANYLRVEFSAMLEFNKLMRYENLIIDLGAK